MINTQTPPVVRLRADAYAAWMDRLKLYTESQQAELLGISRANLGKVRHGTVAPGERFIAAVMAKYDRAFEDLFEIAEAS